jgi:hypothetical protein
VLNTGLAERMRQWQHSGFSVHNRIRTQAATLKRNYQLMPALEWLRLLMNHIPDKHEHLVRCYGYYSHRSQGARRLAEPQHDTSATIVIGRTAVGRTHPQASQAIGPLARHPFTHRP